MASNKKIFRSTLAAVAAATMTILATPAIAYAADGDQVDTGIAGDTDVNLDTMPTQATLVISKRTPSKGAADQRPPANGSDTYPAAAAGEDPKNVDKELDRLGAKPIEGITFTLFKVDGIDLTTNEGWRTARSLTQTWENMSLEDKKTATKLSRAGVDYAITQVGSAKTDANGQIEFTDQPAGLYVVRESIANTDVVKIAGQKDAVSSPESSIIQSAPFVVALPLTNPNDRAKWMNRIHVYPKNSITGLQKAVEDADTRGVGNQDASSQVVYTIKADVPSGYAVPVSQDPATLDNDDATKPDEQIARFKNFQLIDVFDEEGRVFYNSTKQLSTAGADAKAGNIVTLTSSTKADQILGSNDYEIAWHDASLTPDGTQYIKRAVVSLTDTGLAAMAKYSADAESIANDQGDPANVKLEWKFGATLAENAVGDIPNKTYLLPDFPNGSTTKWVPSKDVPRELPEAEVESRYGRVEITKYDGTTEAPLQGAEFKLWVCNEQGQKTSSNSIAVNGVSRFTSDDKGKVVITGLRLNDWKNDSSKKEGSIPEDERDFYCLEEVKAPDNYERLPEMIRFQLLSSDQATENNKKIYKKPINVANVPSNSGFDLPLTGGNGIYPIIALGGLLVAGSAGYAAVATRRKKAEAQA